MGIIIKPKITVKEVAPFEFNEQLKIKMMWSSQTDLDLCLFFKKKDGEVGGMFSNDYCNKISDHGSLEKFPYIRLMFDLKEPPIGDEEVQQIYVTDLSAIAEAYVCIVNYDAAVNPHDVTFEKEGGRVELLADTGRYLEVIADSKEQGTVYLVCSIKNDNGYFLKSEGRVMDIEDAFTQIPGFSLICNS